MKHIRYILLLLAMLAFAACRPERYSPEPEVLCPIRPGDPVCFSMDMEGGLNTKAFPDVSGYTPVASDSYYRFAVEMYKEGTQDEIGSAVYVPELDEENTDGRLVLADEQTPLFWEDNVNAYGFKATAGDDVVVASGADGYCDQHTAVLWTSYDKLLGYAAVGSDDKGVLNHHKIQEWFAQNKADYTAAGMLADDDDLMRIPLYLQHQRAQITVILKAAEGVRREDLQFLTQEENIEMRVFQKSGTAEVVSISPLAEEAFVDYEKDANGPAETHRGTTCYHAIVEPYDYLSVAETDPICTVNLSGQKFSFYASSDSRYNGYKENSLTDEERAEFEKAYKLEPGRHVVITATLSRESRKILITAYVQDWEEVVTSTICDDYGNNGDPIRIESLDALAEALNDETKNMAGNVLLISSDLVIPSDWTGAGKDLKCMLNLAGHSIDASAPMFNKIDAYGSIVNGSVNMKADVPYAIAAENHGTLERVNVTADPGVKASVAGLVKTNYRTIYNCTSALPVYGNPASGDSDHPYYVGGIAAETQQEGTVKPIIDGCRVDAKVDGNQYVAAGGGIVGNATGRVSNNEYGYGVTMSQDANRFKNSVGGHVGYAAEQTLAESNNTWPSEYSGLIDSQIELGMLFYKANNVGAKKYRIAGDFTVDQTWETGICSHSLGSEVSGNVLFELDGNGKTVTLTSTDSNVSAPMLFTNIQNSVRDLTICVDKPIFKPYSVSPTASDDLNIDDFSSVAAFAYAVSGATVSNVKVYTKSDAYIQASNSAGIAVWALNGAVLEGCEFYGTIKGQDAYGSVTESDVEANMTKLSGCLASGGIVAAAERASLRQCVFHDGCAASIPTVRRDKDKTYFGGIVGAVVDSAIDDGHPIVTLTDCTSYLSGTSGHMGAVVGNSVYHGGTPVSPKSGIDSGSCQGNWWRTTENYAVAVKMSLRTDAQTIGKRNSVSPTLDRSWAK